MTTILFSINQPPHFLDDTFSSHYKIHAHAHDSHEKLVSGWKKTLYHALENHQALSCEKRSNG